MGGNQTTAHSDRSIDSIQFWTTKFWLLKIFGWHHPRKLCCVLRVFEKSVISTGNKAGNKY